MKTKDKFLKTGADLFGSQGFSGTGIKQIVKESGATWGSVYHFFPGGKNQLGAEAVLLAATRDAELFRTAFEKSTDVSAGIGAIFKSEMKRLRESSFTYGCTVASVASDVAATSEEVRQACSDAFSLWQETISAEIAKSGIDGKQANFLAGVILSSLEGATLLSRTHKSVKPMKDAMVALSQLIELSR